MLVDTSVWIDHFRLGNAGLASLLNAGQVEGHQFVIGEMACGNIRRRPEVLSLLASLPEIPLAEHDEVLEFVAVHRLMGTGIGWIDAHLLTAAAVHRSTLWTLDRRLAQVAQRLGLGTP